jgi:RNA polymerase sigma-70 factor (ECF subfamily)
MLTAQPAEPTPERTDLSGRLLERCRAQDPVAFRAFVSRHQTAVHALLSRMTGRGPHVDDLAQSTFLKAFVAFPRFDIGRESKASTWLLTIASRVALDQLKSHSVKREVPSAELALVGGECPEQAVHRRRLGLAIEQAAAGLSSERRLAFVLYHFHGFDLSDVAEALGCSTATAKTRLFRARRQLRATLLEQAPELMEER